MKEYLEALEAGHPPDREALLERYPEMAEELAKSLDGIDFLQDVAPQLTEPGSRDLDGAAAEIRPRLALGDFRIVRQVGKGGMGVVYEAEQLSLGRRVALKVLPFAAVMDRRHLQRFKNEAQAAATLHHQNIVPIYAVGCQRGVHYYAMQYIEGQTLAEVISDLRCLEGLDKEEGDRGDQSGSDLAASLASGKFAPPGGPSGDGTTELRPGEHASKPAVPDERAGAETPREPQAATPTQRSTRTTAYSRSVAELGIQAADALEHAHDEGVIHRDIKPSNLMLDARGKIWVTDFGLARIEKDPGLTMTGDILGTVRYMSPEQALAKRIVVDHRTDIYSLGLTLYELLTLRPAFPGQDREVLLRQIAFEEPTAPRRLNRSIPADLETIVLKATAKNPAERYDTAKELADDLRRFLADEPIRARRPSLATKVAKWSRRHRTVVWAAVTILVMAVTGLAVSTALIKRAYEGERHQRQLATDRAGELEIERREALRLRDQAHEAADREKAAAGRERRAREEADRQKNEAERQRDTADRNLYLAHMQLARMDWNAGQTARLHRFLDAHIPKPGRPDCRGWEWHYFLGQCHRDRLTLRGHGGPILSVTWSPDGKRIVSGSSADQTRLWDARSGHEQISPWPHWYGRVAWSPDGRKLVVGNDAGRIKVIDADTGDELLTFAQHRGGVNTLDWSRDGRRIVSGYTHEDPSNCRVRVWDAATGEELFCLGEADQCTVASWSPDSRRLAWAHPGGTVIIWDVATRKEVLRLSHAHEPEDAWSFSVVSLAWSPDGKRLVTGSQDHTIRVWDLATGKECYRAMVHNGQVRAVAWSPDGLLIASASDDQSVRVWDAATGHQVQVFYGHTDEVNCVAWSPGGRQIVSGSLDGTLKIWDVTAKPEDPPFAGHTESVRAIRWSADGSRLATAGSDGTVKVWEAANRKELITLFEGRGEVCSLAWSPDGEYVAFSSEDTVHLVNATTGKEIAAFKSDSGAARAVAFGPDGKVLAVCSWKPNFDQTLTLWDTTTREVVLTVPAAKITPECVSIAWSPSGQRFAAPVWGGVCIWDAKTGKEVLSLSGHANMPCAVVWSPDGTRLASASLDQTIRIWSVGTGDALFVLRGHTGVVRSVDWWADTGARPRPPRLASASIDGTLRIWDPETGQEIVTLRDHPGKLQCVAWSPDGKRLATGAEDGTIKIWDASRGYEIEAEVRVRTDFATARRLREEGKTDEAKALLQRLVAEFPDEKEYRKALAPLFVPPWIHEYWTCEGSTKFEAAIVDLDEALRLDPQFASAYHYRGIARLETGDQAGAVADLTEAIRCGLPASAVYGDACLLRLRGRSAETKALVERLVAEFPEEKEYRKALAQLYVPRWIDEWWTCKDPAKLETGIAVLSKALRLDPEFDWAYHYRGGHAGRTRQLRQRHRRLDRSYPVGPD